ncbi:glycosyltransferase [Rhodobacteraceae bacterium]|nr:glycosyltransferase [Paracoccaceae bacterium]
MSNYVDVLICTFQRPHVTKTLESLTRLKLPDGVSLRVVVADNDDTPSAQKRIFDLSATLPYPVHYMHAPARNISIARNACLDFSDSDWIAFLDDDETVDENWLVNLTACAREASVDGVFGPVLADYDTNAPDWIRQRDYHSSFPVRRGQIVETGHTGNALLRWRGTPWQDERFELARGRSGGEDTEFFNRLYRMGAQYEISTGAIVRETVPKERLSFRWLRRRKVRMGQSYAVTAKSGLARVKLALSAFVKASICTVLGFVNFLSQDRRNYWMLRGALHVGVCYGCVSSRQAELYGHSP